MHVFSGKLNWKPLEGRIKSFMHSSIPEVFIMDNLEEMEKFLERCNLPGLNQEEIENMNRPITNTEIESVI